jgi:ubiquinone/menaquinone biosynthesis C-methylase UbiE
VFWQSDQLQSCVPAGEAVDSSQLSIRWRRFFAALPAAARVLDLGTGNGSVAVEAAAISREKIQPFSIHGIDLAAIDPSRFVTSAAVLLQDIEFQGHTPMERLPFADNCFDAVVSQYGLEYSDMGQSIGEAMRVLRSSGRFQFLLHADDGVLKNRCQLQRQQAEALLGSPLFARLTDALTHIVAAEQQNTAPALGKAKECITALKQAIDDLERTFAGDEDHGLVDNLFVAIRRLPDMRSTYDLNTLLRMADEIRDLLLAQAKRLQAMERAALDDAAIRKVTAQVADHGGKDVNFERATVGKNNSCIGYWIIGNKAVG